MAQFAAALFEVFIAFNLALLLIWILKLLFPSLR